MNQLFIATGNTHKTKEFAELLRTVDCEVLSASACGGMPGVEENGESFSENAQLKAEALRDVAPRGAWILADDSGLEVDFLDGSPGIYSARYAGVGASDGENLQKLLAALSGLSSTRRTARFRCVLCLICPQGRIHNFEGICEGKISVSPTGTKGFGYDPVFIPSGYVKSFAELGEAVKGEVSHRARAVHALIGSQILS